MFSYKQAKYRYPLLFESSLYATSLLLKKNYINMCFHNLKEIQKGYLLLWKKAKIENSVQHFFLQRAIKKVAEGQREWHCQAHSLGTTLSISATSSHGFELCLGASVLCLDLFCASTSKMYPLCNFGLWKVS